MNSLTVIKRDDEPQNAVVHLFAPKRIEIDAPEGMEVICDYERHAFRSMIEYEQLHQKAIDQILAVMGNATIMRFPDGSYYAREVIQREAFTINPEPYSALVFHKGGA